MLCLVTAGDFMHGVSSSVHDVEYLGCNTWCGSAVDGNHAGVEYNKKQIYPCVPMVYLLLLIPLFSEKCSRWGIR